MKANARSYGAGVNFSHTTSSSIEIFGNIDSFISTTSSLDIMVSSDNAAICNCDFNGGSISTTTNDFVIVDNCICLDITASSGTSHKVSNTTFTGAVAASMDDTTFYGCQFDDNLNISGDRVQVIGGRVGTLSVGGTKTISFLAASANCKAIGVHTEAATSDAGTGNVEIGNTTN